ncbi:MAG: low molecular weight phosphotyrosine protein phosphatase [Solobacterium sp.]|nr:low molecular weight phosphotyrosine protein phosphatase [Solobacterium sp.]
MIKVLFICHGNICRSPMAEFILKELVRRKGVQDDFEIASAAVSSEEEGNGLYPPARRKLKEYGIPCEGHRAHKMRPWEYEYYDVIFAMDASNIRRLMDMTDHDPAYKIHHMMEYASVYRDVRDPWYTGNFEETYQDLWDACTGYLESLYHE